MKEQFSYNVENENVDSVDQTAQNVQSDLDLHCPQRMCSLIFDLHSQQKLLVSSTERKELMTLIRKNFESAIESGENVCNQHYLLFSFNLLSINAFHLGWPKIL